MDFSSICRTCLRTDYLNPIFVRYNNNINYARTIHHALGVKVQYNDKLPQKMCTNCIRKLNEIIKFRKQCKDVEKELLRILKKTKPFIIDKEDNSGISLQKTSSSEQLKNDDSNDTSDFKIKSGKVNDDIKYEMDFDDDKPLQDLINDNKEAMKLEEKYKFDADNEGEEPYPESESDTKISDKDKIDSGEIINKCDVEDKKITYSNDSETSDDSNTAKSLLNAMEIPYEILLGPNTEKVARVKCRICYKELSIRSIDSHMTKTHPGADGRKVKCELCDSYVMKHKLNRHNIMMHGGGCYKCGYCHIEFGGKEALIHHVVSCTAKRRIRKVNESARARSECDICHKVMQKASLRMHKAVKHAGLKPVCEHCGKSFGNQFRLKEHYRAKHGYEKFKCSYCDFKSSSIMALRNHERRHRGEKPFVCETCGAKFHAAYLLTQHKHSHRTEKLVKCDQCPSTFKANNSLHMHKLTCHSSYTYRCKVCCRSYKCRHYAVKHVRHVHRYSGPTPPLVVVGGESVVATTT